MSVVMLLRFFMSLIFLSSNRLVFPDFFPENLFPTVCQTCWSCLAFFFKKPVRICLVSTAGARLCLNNDKAPQRDRTGGCKC
jgi:hypothetical protein